jgi:hypothetical protein
MDQTPEVGAGVGTGQWELSNAEDGFRTVPLLLACLSFSFSFSFSFVDVA